jgi:hypothetical protein
MLLEIIGFVLFICAMIMYSVSVAVTRKTAWWAAILVAVSAALWAINATFL